MNFDLALRSLSVAVLVLTTWVASQFHPPLPFETQYDYAHKPAGYHWTVRRDPNTGDIVYYGVDPANHYTVYVGPDSIYYEFAHPPPITPADLHSTWIPRPAMQGQMR
jgi:hypothetical protein